MAGGASTRVKRHDKEQGKSRSARPRHRIRSLDNHPWFGKRPVWRPSPNDSFVKRAACR